MSGFVYIWFDRKYKRYYIGSHWGKQDDGYICSSNWMRTSYKRRSADFKRRILKTIDTCRIDLLAEENRYLSMIKPEEIKPINPNPRYYNLNTKAWKNWHNDDETCKTVGQKISAAKKGKKTGPRDPSVGEAISKAKKESFARREAELGYKFSPSHIKSMSEVRTGNKHTDEWKAQNSERLKKQWADGTRKPYGPMSEEHKKKIAVGNTGKKRQDVSNYKTAHSKKYRITAVDGSSIEIHGLKKYASDNNIPYVTLHKASQKGWPVVKYGILEISLV